MILLINYWSLFCIAFGLMLLFTFFMSVFSLNFYTWDAVKKKFSIMDLEIPATPKELVNLIKGLYKLPRPDAIKVIKALRWHLYIDFLFMPCAYGCVFLLCMLVSAKMKSYGVQIFIGLAWAQLIPWLCDIIENIYLLRKIKPHPHLSTDAVHKTYLIMEAFKWGIALTAGICAIAAICYFWLAGQYAVHLLYYLLIITSEIILFLICGKLILKKKKKRRKKNQIITQTNKTYSLTF